MSDAWTDADAAAPTSSARATRASLASWLQAETSAALAARVGIVVLAGGLLAQATRFAGALPEDAYARGSLFLGAMARPEFVVVLVVTLVPLVLFRRRWTWAHADLPPVARWGTAILVGVVAWSLAASPPNFYYGHAFALDRLVLVALAAACVATPLALPVFGLAATAFVGQFSHPIQGLTWSDKVALYDALAIVSAAALAGLVGLRARAPLVLALLGFQAAHYAIAGGLKVAMLWPFHDQLADLAWASWLNGWMSGWSQERFAGLAGFVRALNAPLLWGTLVVELGVLAMGASRRVAAVFLAGAIGLHLGIFALTGILFWKWMILDAVLVALVWLVPLDAKPRWRNVALVVAVAAVAPVLFHPPQLAWFDSPLVVTYELEGVTASGEAVPIPRLSLAPYDVQMAQDRFAYLDPHPQLVGTYGAVGSLATLQELRAAGSLDAAEAVAAREGKVRLDEAAAREFDALLVAWRDAPASGFPGALGPPPHIFTTGGDLPVERSELREVRVVRTAFYIDGDRIDRGAPEVVRTVTFP